MISLFSEQCSPPGQRRQERPTVWSGGGAQRRKHKRAVPGHVMIFLDMVKMMIFFIGVQEVINLTNYSLNGEL